MKRIFTKLSVFTFLCFLFTNVALAQNITVKGTVSDGADKTTLPGVSIQVKGSTAAVQTDASGKYSIAAPANGTLVFTYIGYATKEVAINNQTTVNVVLSSSVNELDAVVVVGYGTQKKRDLTGSIASIKGEEIEKFAVTNPVAALQGKVPGLTVFNSGTPGASPKVRIRGTSSTKDANPLYVVDGLLQDNIDFLNPADIETIDLLRDASSAAIYGLRGANGVIAITTKRAARGKTTINFQSTLGLQHIAERIAVADAEGFKKLYSTQLANQNAALFDFKNYTANTNWQDLMIRDAVINTNSLSISNTGEKSTTLLSLGYNNQDGVIKYNNFKKFTARLNEEIRINDNIKVGADLSGFHWRREPAPVGLNTAIYAAPIVPVKEGDLYYSMPSFQRTSVGNIMSTIERTRNTSIERGYRFNGSLYAEVKFLKNFTWKSTVYTDLGFNNTRKYNPLAATYIELGEGNNPTRNVYDSSVKTSINQIANEYRKYQQDHLLNFDKEFEGGHKLNAMVGFTTIYSSSTGLEGTRRDTTLNIPYDPNMWYLDVVNENNPSTNKGFGNEESNAGVFGRVSYGYQNKYLVNATVRRDGSSRFAQNNRWGTFGSIGLGWVASEEDFFKEHIKDIDFLKLRASWGRLGNSNGVTPNLYQQTLKGGSSAVFGDYVYTAVQEAYRPDPNLRFEIVQGIDLGLDIRALDNRLSAEINLYNKTTDGILTSYILPSEGIEYFTNLGKITNKGIELSFSWADKIGSDFIYSISPNFSYVKNIVNSVGNTSAFQILGNGGINVTETGKSIGYFYGYKQAGIYQTPADLLNYGSFADSAPGDIRYEDLDGDKLITAADRMYLGTPFPPYSYGLNVSVAYKGFDATLDGQGVAGNKIYVRRRSNNFAVFNYEANRLNAWTAPGSTNVEPILNAARGNNYLFSSYFLEPGDYFRLRNIQLGYTFGSAGLNKIGVNKLRVYVSGQNIKTWSKVTGYTPEAQIDNPISSGVDNGVYPVPAIYSFGLNVTF